MTKLREWSVTSARTDKKDKSGAPIRKATGWMSNSEVLRALMAKCPGRSSAFDLTTTDEDGNSRDFTKEQMKDKARKKVRTEKPMFLIGSTSCSAFCMWQASNAAGTGPVTRRSSPR